MRYFSIICICAFILCSCQDATLNEVLSLSKDNRAELEKVLEHYKDDPLKREAAEFLICNMPGNIAYDSTHIGPYRSIILELDSLKNNGVADAYDIIYRKWLKFSKSRSVEADIYANVQQDLYSIKSDYLIDNIERAFTSWNKTQYKDSVDFNTFLRYVLPYRQVSGYVIEPWWNYFVPRYGHYTDRYVSPRQTVDSVMKQVSDYVIDVWSFRGFPYISLKDYNMTKLSHCSVRCWFNSLILTSLGIPCTIDFVPAWGNRNSNHEWNAIIIGGKTHAFESAIEEDKDKWNAQRVYNNVWIDESWMKSRLPKVFRHSYESTDKGPSTNVNCNRSNTPPLFLNSKFKDVSQEYFATSDIKVPIDKQALQDCSVEYIYIFVFNDNAWKPVYWGELKYGKACFERMGRDQVYLAGIYQNGMIIPVNDPFIVQSDGSVHYLKAETEYPVNVTLVRKYYSRPDIDFWRNRNMGARIESSKDRMCRNVETVFTIPACEPRPNVWMLDAPVTTRYLRYLFPEHLDVLAELSFFSKNPEGELEALKVDYFSSNPKVWNEVRNVFDGDILTYADLNGIERDKEEHFWIGIDLGKPMEVAAIGLCPRNDKNNVIKGLEYELFYWNNQWISLGKKVATDYQLEYDNVPDNALLLLKCTTEGSENRIFTWDGTRQIMW